jgi:thioredoxin-related protein
MKTLKVTIIAVLALCTLASPSAKTQTTVTGSRQQETTARVKWMSWEEALQKSQIEKRKILLDVYTEGCRWCKYMETTTFQQPQIAAYLNDNFYPVKFDAERREELVYLDKTYKYVKQGSVSYHELAAELLRGRLQLPALVFMDENLRVIQSFVGYKTPQQLEKIATYFATDHYKRTPWSTFQKNFKSMIADK